MSNLFVTQKFDSKRRKIRDVRTLCQENEAKDTLFETHSEDLSLLPFLRALSEYFSVQEVLSLHSADHPMSRHHVPQ